MYIDVIKLDVKASRIKEKAVEKIQKKFQKDEKEKKLFPDAMKTSFPEGQQNIIDGKVIPYIQEHFSETLTVTEIADYADRIFD